MDNQLIQNILQQCEQMVQNNPIIKRKSRNTNIISYLNTTGKNAFSCTCGVIFASNSAKSSHKCQQDIFYKLSSGSNGIKGYKICFFCGSIGKIQKKNHNQCGKIKFEQPSICSGNRFLIQNSQKIKPLYNIDLFITTMYKWNLSPQYTPKQPKQSEYFQDCVSILISQQKKQIYDYADVEEIFQYPTNIHQLYDMFAALVFHHLNKPKKITMQDLMFVQPNGFYDILSAINVTLLLERFGEMHPKIWYLDEQKIDLLRRSPLLKYKSLGNQLIKFKTQNKFVNNNFLVHQKINTHLMEGIFQFTNPWAEPDVQKMKYCYNLFMQNQLQQFIPHKLIYYQARSQQFNDKFELQVGKSILQKYLMKTYLIFKQRFYQFKSGLNDKLRIFNGFAELLTNEQLKSFLQIEEQEQEQEQSSYLNIIPCQTKQQWIFRDELTPLNQLNYAIIYNNERIQYELHRSEGFQKYFIQQYPNVNLHSLKKRFSEKNQLKPLFNCIEMVFKKSINFYVIENQSQSYNFLLNSLCYKLQKFVGNKTLNYDKFSEKFKQEIKLSQICYIEKETSYQKQNIETKLKFFKLQINQDEFMQYVLEKQYFFKINKITMGHTNTYIKLNRPIKYFTLQQKQLIIGKKKANTKYSYNKLTQKQIFIYWLQIVPTTKISKEMWLILGLLSLNKEQKWEDIKQMQISKQLFQGVQSIDQVFEDLLKLFGFSETCTYKEIMQRVNILYQKRNQVIKINDFQFQNKIKLMNWNFQKQNICSWFRNYLTSTNYTDKYCKLRIKQQQYINTQLIKLWFYLRDKQNIILSKQLKLYSLILNSKQGKMFFEMKKLWLQKQSQKLFKMLKQKKLIDQICSYQDWMRNCGQAFADRIAQQFFSLIKQNKKDQYNLYQIYQQKKKQLKYQTINFINQCQKNNNNLNQTLLILGNDFKNKFKVNQVLRKGKFQFVIEQSKCSKCQCKLIYEEGLICVNSKCQFNISRNNYPSNYKSLNISFQSFNNNKSIQKYKYLKKDKMKNNLRQRIQSSQNLISLTHNNFWYGDFPYAFEINCQILNSNSLKTTKVLQQQFDYICLNIIDDNLYATAKIEAKTFIGFYAGEIRQMNQTKDIQLKGNFVEIGLSKFNFEYYGIFPQIYCNHLTFAHFDEFNYNCIIQPFLVEVNKNMELKFAVKSTKMIYQNNKIIIKGKYYKKKKSERIQMKDYRIKYNESIEQYNENDLSQIAHQPFEIKYDQFKF